ncbi:hypothetical protein AAY473_007612 [Plecturocebus cupreus]
MIMVHCNLEFLGSSSPPTSASQTWDLAVLLRQVLNFWTQAVFLLWPPKAKQSSHLSLLKSWDHRYSSPHPANFLTFWRDRVSLCCQADLEFLGLSYSPILTSQSGDLPHVHHTDFTLPLLLEPDNVSQDLALLLQLPNDIFKSAYFGRAQWITPVIPELWEANVGRLLERRSPTGCQHNPFSWRGCFASASAQQLLVRGKRDWVSFWMIFGALI